MASSKPFSMEKKGGGAAAALGVGASLVSIFVFATGYQSVWQLFERPAGVVSHIDKRNDNPGAPPAASKKAEVPTSQRPKPPIEANAIVTSQVPTPLASASKVHRSYWAEYVPRTAKLSSFLRTTGSNSGFIAHDAGVSTEIGTLANGLFEESRNALIYIAVRFESDSRDTLFVVCPTAAVTDGSNREWYVSENAHERAKQPKLNRAGFYRTITEDIALPGLGTYSATELVPEGTLLAQLRFDSPGRVPKSPLTIDFAMQCYVKRGSTLAPVLVESKRMTVRRLSE